MENEQLLALLWRAIVITSISAGLSHIHLMARRSPWLKRLHDLAGGTPANFIPQSGMDDVPLWKPKRMMAILYVALSFFGLAYMIFAILKQAGCGNFEGWCARRDLDGTLGMLAFVLALPSISWFERTLRLIEKSSEPVDHKPQSWEMHESAEALEPNRVAAYHAATYTIASPTGPITVKPHAQTNAMRDLLQRYGVHTGAFITAYNPFSRLDITDANRRRAAHLISDVSRRWAYLASESRSQDGGWREPGVFVLGIDLEKAMELGRRHQQNTFVFCTADGACELKATWPENQRLIERSQQDAKQ